MQLVVRTLSVLRHLGENREGQTLLDLSTALGIPSPTLHRLLGVLVQENFVVRSDDKRYAMGPAALALTNGARPLDDVAWDHMRRLSRATKETVFLTELVGEKTVCVSLVEGTRPLRLSVRVGQELPLHAAASARAILAQLPDADVQRLLGSRVLTSFTPETPTSLENVAAHLADLRVRGYDVCDEELDLNVIAMSAPIRGGRRAAPASLTIAGPRDRVTEVVRNEWATVLLSEAEAISAELGAEPSRLPAAVASARGGQ